METQTKDSRQRLENHHDQLVQACIPSFPFCSHQTWRFDSRSDVAEESAEMAGSKDISAISSLASVDISLSLVENLVQKIIALIQMSTFTYHREKLYWG